MKYEAELQLRIRPYCTPRIVPEKVLKYGPQNQVGGSRYFKIL
jgi:hypothetical protein